jgi:nucleolar protein 15
VAKIVAETMDKYLLYGHILRCKYVPPEQLHPDLWKGSNRRYKVIPWNRVERNRLEGGKTRDKWEKKIQQEQRRRSNKAEKLKALGYEFDMPKIKATQEVSLPQNV